MIVWDEAAARWRDGIGGPEIDAARVIAARDGLANGYEARFGELAEQLVTGAVRVDEWGNLFLELLLTSVAHGYLFGRGGIDLMADDDWERVVDIFTEQQRYADQFIVEVREIAEQRGEGLTVLDALQYKEQRIASRSRLYAGASVQSFERAQVYRVWRQHLNASPLSLPVYPTQRSECMMRCRCHWLIVANDTDQLWRCRWITEEDSSVCPTCRRRGEVYRQLEVPYRVPDVSWLDVPTIEAQPVLGTP